MTDEEKRMLKVLHQASREDEADAGFISINALANLAQVSPHYARQTVDKFCANGLASQIFSQSYSDLISFVTLTLTGIEYAVNNYHVLPTIKF